MNDENKETYGEMEQLKDKLLVSDCARLQEMQIAATLRAEAARNAYQDALPAALEAQKRLQKYEASQTDNPE